jgi:integrase
LHPHTGDLAMSKYLRREADSFFFRRRVPPHLQSRFGIKEIYRSLRTTVRKTANVRAAQLYVASERLFDLAADETLTDEDFRAAARHWMSQPRIKQYLKRHVDDLTPGRLKASLKFFPDNLLVTIAPDGDYNERAIMLEEAGDALEDAGFRETPEALDLMLDAMRQVLDEYVGKRVRNVFQPELDQVPTVVTGHSLSQAASVTAASFNRISTFIKPWQKDIAVGYNHNKPVKDADQYLKTVELFVGLLGDLPLGQITYDKAAEFRELVLQLPSTHGKGATQSLKKELVRARDDTTLPRVSMKTVKRHFSGMNSIWKWLIFRKHVPASHNPFSGHSFPGTKSKKSARDDWSSEDLQRFFTSRIYHDATGGSALRWLPLIALHSGMRLEEICRLRPAVDIVMKNGVHCFDVAPREGWDPKTESGTRVIPVHSWLIRHGFMDFVKAQRGRNVEHLFSPELSLHKGSLSSAFSREFSRIKIDLGVGTKTTFHSFRHTFRTVLESTDLKDSHIDAVMGHEGGGSEGRTYTKRVSTTKLKEVVESFRSPLDLSFLDKGASDLSPPPLKVQIKKRKLTPPVFGADGKLIRPSSKRG